MKELLHFEGKDYDHKNGNGILNFNVLMAVLEIERDMYPDQIIKLIIEIAEFVC